MSDRHRPGWPTAAGGLALMAWLSSCATPVDRPAWIDQPKSPDGMCFYQVGHASASASPETARQAAFQDALAQISKSILSSVRVQGSDVKLASALQIRDAEIMPGCVHTMKAPSGYDCWVQVSYPLSEKTRIWNKLASSWRLEGLDALKVDFSLQTISSGIDRILAGRMVGRGVLDLRA